MADINLAQVLRKNPALARAEGGPSHLGDGGTPPGWLLDKWAEEKLSAGFDTRRSNICPECHMARSANGTCMGCDE